MALGLSGEPNSISSVVVRSHAVKRIHPQCRKFSDRTEQLRRWKALSPVNRVGRGFPPTLLFHGAKDTHVPVQQSERMAEALKAAGVDVELVVKPNREHGWPDNATDQKTLVEWLDRRLLSKP